MKLMLDPAVGGAAGGGAIPAAAAGTPAPASPSVAVAAAPPSPTPAAPAATTPAAPAATGAGFMAAPDPKAAPPQPVAQPKTEFKLPEGVKMEPAALEAYERLMKESGMTQAQTEKLIERDLKQQKEQYDSTVSQMKGQNQKWFTELQAKHGAKWAEMDSDLKKVLDYGDPSGNFRKGLAAMEMQYNPELVGFLERFIPLFRGPSLAPPSSTGVTQQDNRSPQEKLAEHYRGVLKQTQAAPMMPFKITR